MGPGDLPIYIGANAHQQSSERAETPSSSRCHLGLLLGPEVLSSKVDLQCEDQQLRDASSKASAKHHAGRAARADAS